MPHIRIATPSTGIVKAQFTSTLASTIIDLAEHRIAVEYSRIESGDLPLNRNRLATHFLDDARLTHLFFIDADMSFTGEICRRLLAHDKPFIAAPAMTREQNPKDHIWRITFSKEQIGIVNGITPDVREVGLACALIRRDTLASMIEKSKLQRVAGFYPFFSHRPQDAGRGHISEDAAFCRRWTEDCGGIIWAMLDARIGHVGDFAYGADQSCLESMQARGHFIPKAAAAP